MFSVPGEAPGDTTPELVTLPITVPVPIRTPPLRMTLAAVTLPPLTLSRPEGATVIACPAALMAPLGEATRVPSTPIGPVEPIGPPLAERRAPDAMLVVPDRFNAPAWTSRLPE